jgi:hypothetical protein
VTEVKTPQEYDRAAAQEYGRIGARRRWGPPRNLSIGDLPPESRQRIIDVIAIERAKAKAS